ncbi:hypothetical protein [Natrinema versiforme]|nr:hypothetical protein [Natrinema versiforme]
MDQRRRDLLVAGGGMLALGTYAVITGQAGELETNTGVLLAAGGLGAAGAVIEYAWNRTILRVMVAAVGGGIIGVLVSSGAWFEVLGVFFSGILLARGGRYTLERWLSDSSPPAESTPSR